MARAARPASDASLLKSVHSSFAARWATALAVLAGVLGVPAPSRGADDGGDLRLVIILTRHGIRRPLAKDAYLSRMAAQPWPEWEVPTGYLTPRGAVEMTQMGAYYRALYAREGLLSGDAAADAARISFRADNDERSIASAHQLAAGLMPGAVPEITILPPGRMDPLFQPVKLPVGHPDAARATAEVLARIPGGIPALLEEHRGECELLERVLFGADGRVPPGKISPFAQKPWVGRENGSDALVSITPIHTCMTTVEALLLEYEDGMPMKDVGWGRVSPGDLLRLLRLHELYWDLAQATGYVAQAEGSNLASHLRTTIDQAVTGQPEPGALAGQGCRLLVVEGHDTNLITVAALMNLSWRLPGTPPRPVFPGGALVFELRRHGAEPGYFVRIAYVADTPDRIRARHVPTLADPPFNVPVPIPGCGDARPPFDAPYGKFREMLGRAIDPQFVVP
jgi:4-phytase/acid phosphatase